MARQRSLRWPTRHTRWYGDTFVYFGSIQPWSTPKLLLVANPAVPRWMISRMLAVTPHLFDYFAQQTGTTLEFQPLAFVSWERQPHAGLFVRRKHAAPVSRSRSCR